MKVRILGEVPACCTLEGDTAPITATSTTATCTVEGDTAPTTATITTTTCTATSYRSQLAKRLHPRFIKQPALPGTRLAPWSDHYIILLVLLAVQQSLYRTCTAPVATTARVFRRSDA